jgi:hypothetical protein
MRALAECLPAYVPAHVPFVAVEYSKLSLVQLLAHALHALPVLQVSVGVSAARACARAGGGDRFDLVLGVEA